MTPEEQFRSAFLATSYGTAQDRFRLSVVPGAPCPLFGDGSQWAILTAHNPDGMQQTAALNDEAQRRLELRLGGYRTLDGVNGEGEWAEASFIVYGLPLHDALSLGLEFGQVAVLHGAGQRVDLVWCDSGRAEPYRVSGVSGTGAG